MIVVKSFDFGDYPFPPGKWNEFELIEFPKIVSILSGEIIFIESPILSLSFSLSFVPTKTPLFSS